MELLYIVQCRASVDRVQGPAEWTLLRHMVVDKRVNRV